MHDKVVLKNRILKQQIEEHWTGSLNEKRSGRGKDYQS